VFANCVVVKNWNLSEFAKQYGLLVEREVIVDNFVIFCYQNIKR